MSETYSRSPRLAWRMYEDQGIVLDAKGKKMFGLNGSAALVWDMLASPVTEQDLAAAVSERFGVQPSVAEQDVQQFLQSLIERELIQVSSAESA